MNPCLARNMQDPGWPFLQTVDHGITTAGAPRRVEILPAGANLDPAAVPGSRPQQAAGGRERPSRGGHAWYRALFEEGRMTLPCGIYEIPEKGFQAGGPEVHRPGIREVARWGNSGFAVV